MKKTNRILVVLAIAFVLFFLYYTLSLFQIGVETSYYVSNDGDDSNTGLSPEVPWQTIEKVNSEMEDGVISRGGDIFFKRGDTFGDVDLKIRLGGCVSDKMIIGAYGTGAKPFFDNVSVYARVGSIGHIIIQDLEVATNVNNTNGITFNLNDLSDINIFNCEVHDCDNNGIYIAKTDGYKIENCVVYDCGNSGIVVQGSDNYKVTNGEIRNCTVYNIRANDGINIHYDGLSNPVGPNHLVVNCIGYNCGEEAIDITAAENVYIKDCEGYGNGVASVVIGHGSTNVTIDNYYSHDENKMCLLITYAQNVIIRNSVAYNSNSYLLNVYGKSPSDLSENITFYNNVLVWSNVSDDIMLAEDIMTLNFKNNIFTSTGDIYPGRLLKIIQGGNTNNRNMIWSHNIWWGGDGGVDNDTWWYIDDPGVNLNWGEWSALDEVSNDLRIDPKLIDPINGDFRIQSYSPAIDAGVFLTTTNGGGWGTVVTVHEANYFCDGYGLVDGDFIFVGDDKYLEVIDIDYSTGQITVNRHISWSDDEPVTLAYTGSAPNIGFMGEKEILLVN